jgi:hypothetical protein
MAILIEDGMPVKMPITQQVSECIEAGMTVEDGSKYVDMYDDGYRLIAKMILIAKHHRDPAVKTKAAEYLVDFNQRGGVGSNYRAALKFITAHKVKQKVSRRRSAVRGLHLLRPYEKSRIITFLRRSDIKEEHESEVKRIHASIVDDRITIEDYRKIRGMLLIYDELSRISSDRTKRNRGKNGWRTIGEKTETDFKTLLERQDVADSDKRKLTELLSQVEDGRMKTNDFLTASQLVTVNRTTKREREKKITASSTFENAVLMACQACDNLYDMKVPLALSEERRKKLVSRLSASAAGLLRLQCRVLREEEEDEG